MAALTIDSTPHIFDEIYKHLDYAGLLVVRRTSRAMRQRVDRTLSRHISLEDPAEYADSMIICHPSGGRIPGTKAWHERPHRYGLLAPSPAHSDPEEDELETALDGEMLAPMLEYLEVVDIVCEGLPVGLVDFVSAAKRRPVVRLIGPDRRPRHWSQRVDFALVIMSSLTYTPRGRWSGWAVDVHAQRIDSPDITVRIPYPADDRELAQLALRWRVFHFSSHPGVRLTVLFAGINGPTRAPGWYTRPPGEGGLFTDVVRGIVQLSHGPFAALTVVGLLDLPPAVLGLNDAARPQEYVDEFLRRLETIVQGHAPAGDESWREAFRRHYEGKVRIISVDEYRREVGEDAYALRSSEEVWLRA